MSLTRRGAGRRLLAGMAVGAAASQPALAAKNSSPRTFVLVHGAWHGGWCWKYVTEILTAQGHRVHTPTLTGLADRSHLLSTGITLDTHIADIVNLFRWNDLEEGVLVAHSYGGWPVSGALEEVWNRVSSVVFVDAFLPESGQRVVDLNAQRQDQLVSALERGEAGRPVPDAGSFGVIDPARKAWVQAKMTPQPTGVALQQIVLSGARNRVVNKTYVRAAGYPQARFDAYLAAAKADPTWKTFVFERGETGHDIMVDVPEKLAAILLSAAA